LMKKPNNRFIQSEAKKNLKIPETAYEDGRSNT